QVSSGFSSARRILELLRTETALDQNKAGYHAPMRGDIRFDHVTFHYGVNTQSNSGPQNSGAQNNNHEQIASQSALTDISFEIKAGQTLALVGQTGAGKSTIAKLINRIYDVQQGQVTVDG